MRTVLSPKCGANMSLGQDKECSDFGGKALNAAMRRLNAPRGTY